MLYGVMKLMVKWTESLTLDGDGEIDGEMNRIAHTSASFASFGTGRKCEKR